MPVIREEDEGLGVLPVDFTDLLDIPETAFDGSNDFLNNAAAGVDPNGADYLPNDFLGDWDLPQPANQPFAGLEEPDYGKFENWIPEFIRPEKPCDYCRVRRLNCYITRGDSACTPCCALFRECSLTKTQTLEGLNSATGHLLDTLHVVDEDACKEQGSLTGIKPLRSKAGAGRDTSVRPDDAPGSSKRNGIRFPRYAVKVLRDWLDAHSDNPYPTEEEKAELEKRTELKPSQIANWLANARRRRKVTEKAKRPMSSPSLRATTPAIAIPAADKPWDELNPFERWQHSPPENEPAAMTDIVNAVANSDLPDDQVSTSPSSAGKRRKRSSVGSGFSNARPASTTSFETGQSSSLSNTNSAAWSQHSSQSRGSFGSFGSGLAGKKDRRRRRRTAPAAAKKAGDEKRRIFQCTFCTDTFKSKYDWTRHEKSLHLSLEKWICAPLGPVISDPTTGMKKCVYCDAQDPSDDHLETHNHRQCEEKGMDSRTFYRKDHLRQHLRLMHNCEMTPFMDNWKSIAVNINSRCGFCAKRFSVWQDRVDHLTAHFKAGARMVEWKGCRGLDPNVAAQVTNAMPPYLIGMESVSPNPFSATDRGTWREDMTNEGGYVAPDLGNLYTHQILDHKADQERTGLPAKATCWEILTIRLGRYANEMVQKGMVLTDEMLQKQARIILYDEDDTWNQTAADNPEWLDLFKKAHGLDFIPDAVGGTGEKVPEDLETYGDLGLRIPFSLQLKAYNASEARKQQERDAERTVWSILSKEGVLHDVNGKCKHTECEDNVFDFHAVEGNVTPKPWRWCTYQLPPEKVKEIAALTCPSRMDDRVDDERERAQNILQGLASMNAADQRREGGGYCEDGYDMQIRKAMARAKGLELMSNIEGQEPNEPQPQAFKNGVLPRHRYELPKERAARYETTTGAWEDSGMMPAAVTTASAPTMPNFAPIDISTTSTGAMMEFLGGDIGQHLPFSSDAETSRIPLGGFPFRLPTTAAEEEAMNRDIDLLIAQTTAAQTQAPATAAGDFDFGAPMMNDVPMQDGLGFDMDMDFDGVFDMPLDETFDMSGIQ